MGHVKSFDEFKRLYENLEMSLWETHGENLPQIFKQTIYRLPTSEELKEFENFNLSSKEILQGFGYTIIGRGISSHDNNMMIINAIQSLCEMYPDNKEYKAALTEAKYKPTLTKLSESEKFSSVKKGQKCKVKFMYFEGNPEYEVEAYDDSMFNEERNTEYFSFLHGGDMMMIATFDGEKWISK